MLTILLSLFGVGFVLIAAFALVSLYGNRGRKHIHRYGDDWQQDDKPVYLVEVICRWQDRNALRIFQVVFFYVCLQTLRACVQL